MLKQEERGGASDKHFSNDVMLVTNGFQCSNQLVHSSEHLFVQF